MKSVDFGKLQACDTEDNNFISAPHFGLRVRVKAAQQVEYIA